MEAAMRLVAGFFRIPLQKPPDRRVILAVCPNASLWPDFIRGMALMLFPFGK